MICPQCGYERVKNDDIISLAECPKCGIIYSKWKLSSAGAQKVSTTAQSDQSGVETEVKRKYSTERLVIYAALVVVLIVLLHAFIVPSLIKIFKSEKNETNVAADKDTSAEINRPLSDNPEAVSSELPTLSENVLPRQELSVADIVRANRESIVVIKTSAGAIGSGFFISREGYIVTNKHVLPNNSQAQIKTTSGKMFNVLQVVREDLDGDLVIASTDAPPQESKPVNINAGLPESGEKIIVIGSPLGLEQTVSDGIVSAVRQNQKSVNFIQITAPVSPGNSGGPLLNMRGEVIGVATFQYNSGQNLNFCVAASRIIDLQQGTIASNRSSGGDLQSPQGRDVYVHADSSGRVSFVEWRTGMQISRPDGTLDRVKFEKWVMEQIGGNPDTINPEKEARDDVERNREQLFKSVFPHRSVSDTNLTSAENEWLKRRYQRHYVEVYNQWMARRNDAIRKYHSMMNEFDRFNAGRK